MTSHDLVDEFRKHYEARGLPPDAIDYLLAEIPNGIQADYLIRIGAKDLHKPISVRKLVEELQKVRSDTSLGASANDVEAIYYFSCGYRLKHRPVTALGEEIRLPGKNNRALAEIAARLKMRTPGTPLYAQFEIADALDDYTDVAADYSSPPKDMGTVEVIRWFVQDSNSKGRNFKTVFVVAHQHHTKRCLLLLRDKVGVVGVPSPEQYSEYDPLEKQDRVISPRAFILSDAVSTAWHLGTR